MDHTIADKKYEGADFRARRITFTALSILIGLISSLVLIELGLRFFDLSYRNRPLDPHPVLHHVHPTSYAFRSHFGGHAVYYDQNGLVADPNGRAAKTADCRIAFFGDSFTESRQVTYGKSFVGLLDSLTGCTVRNYGVASYSPILYYLQWKHSVEEWEPTMVVLQLFSNDSNSDKDYFGKAEFNASGRPVAVPGPSKDRFGQLLRKSYLLRFLRKMQLTATWAVAHWDEDKNVVGGLVEEDPAISKISMDMVTYLNREVVESGAEFALTVVPSKFRLHNQDRTFSQLEFADKWKAWAAGKEIKYIDLVRPFQEATTGGESMFFERDIHFNEAGHAVVADTIRRSYPSVFKSDSF